MAASFTNSTHNLRNTSVPARGGSGSIFVRVKPNWNHNDSQQHGIWDYSDSSPAAYPHFQKYSDNSVYVGWYAGAEYRLIVAATSAMFTSGTWANHLFTWDDAADQQYYYVDDALLGSRTTSFTIGTPNGTLTIGNFNRNQSQVDLNATLAEFGCWNRVLDAGERAILQATGTPLWVPRGLVDYYSLQLRHAAEPGHWNGYDLTIASGVVNANHPRTIYPPVGMLETLTAAAAINPYVIGGGVSQGVICT